MLPGLASTARARSNHEIMHAAFDVIDKAMHELRAIAAIAAEKNDDIAFRGKSANTGSAGASPCVRFGDHSRARTSGRAAV